MTANDTINILPLLLERLFLFVSNQDRIISVLAVINDLSSLGCS